ncbi:MAG: HEAT repeat domain-containing protein [Armatimonadetes bacterium]|nr:HEAT repeat domain-containing protein [Armatimonadota bacterium]
MAASEFDSEPIRRFIGSFRSKVPFRERVMLACRFPGESDLFVAAAASAAIGDTKALEGLSKADLERLVRMVDMTDYPSNSPARPFLLAALTVADYPKAVRASVDDPDEGSIEQLKRLWDSVSDLDSKTRIATIRRLNGDASASPTGVPRNIEQIIAARRAQDVSMVPMLRVLIKDPNTSSDQREAALGALAELSLDPTDRDLIMRFLDQKSLPWTRARVDVALALSDGWRLLYRAVETTELNSPDGQNLIASICSFPSLRVNPGLQNEVVRACSRLDWEHIGVLDPTWCKTYGDDDLKDKYALLLGNNLYDGRIKALRLFAASGHKLIGEELVKTAGRGLIDETVACLEAVGENGIADQVPFVLGYTKDNRWRVREAAAYALGLLPLNIEGDEALDKLAHDPNKAVVRTAIGPRPDLSHRAVSGREVPSEVALKFRGPGSSVRAKLRLWRSWGT